MRFRFVPACTAIVVLSSGLIAWALSRVGIHQGYMPDQPIAFSHEIHAGGNKIPCLYCHYAARTSRHAGIPPASVCMNCHALLEKQTVEIEKLKEAVQQRRPIRWIRVHSLPDFVYFNHSQHLLSGVACQRCHGPVEHMNADSTGRATYDGMVSRMSSSTRAYPNCGFRKGRSESGTKAGAHAWAGLHELSLLTRAVGYYGFRHDTESHADF